MGAVTDYYAILETPRDASLQAIRKAYLKQVRHWHPYLNKSPDATARTQQIVAAAEILLDPTKRSAYDEA